MIRLIRVAVLAAIAILGLSLGTVLGVGTAQAAPALKAEGGPATLVVTLTGGPANASCGTTIKRTSGDTTTTRTAPLQLNNKGDGATTFTRLPAGKYDVVAQCPGTGFFNTTATVTAPSARPCVTIVRDIAMAIGLRGTELNTVVALARQFCP